MKEKWIESNITTRPKTKLTLLRNVVWHYTANPGASAENHFTYFNQTLPDQNKKIYAEALALTVSNPEEHERLLKTIRYASAHTFIDKEQILNIIPLNEVAYHASQANPYSIGVELCIEKDGSIHPETFKKAVEYGAYLHKTYGLKVEDYLRHYDVTGKICPKPWVDQPSEWERFKKAVKAKIEGQGGKKMQLEDWQWTMLGDALTELSKTGGGATGTRQLLSYEWAEKAYKQELTLDEVLFINTVALARSQKREVEVRK